MQEFLSRLIESLQSVTDVEARLITSFLAIVIFGTLRFLAMRLVYRRVDDPKALYQWNKTLTYVSYVLIFLALGRIWIRGFESVSTYLGLLSAGLAIALRDPIVNMAGWIFILWRRPFEVGDRVEVGGYRGDVIDIRIFQFTLMEVGNWVAADQSTGRMITIPNGTVFQAPQANYTKAFTHIWNEIPILVTFESNWEEAKKILTEIAYEEAGGLSKPAAEKIRLAARSFMIHFKHLTPRVYTEIADSGVLLTIRYLCDARERRKTEELISERILARFAEQDDIDFAYPSYRIYQNQLEGKPGAKAPFPPAAPAD